MKLIPDFLRRMFAPHSIGVMASDPFAARAEDATLFPDGETRPLTADDTQRLVQSAYADLPPADQQKIVESAANHFEFDTPYNASYQSEKLGVPGKFTLLREWVWTERMDVLERAHQAWERNPLAKTGVSWTTRFAIGKGGTLTYKAAAVKEVLEEFINDPMNSFQAYEREFCDALQVDGEIWVRFFTNAQGRVVIIPLRPWHIQWITSDPENYKEILSYHYVYMIYQDYPGAAQMGITDVPADEILHVAINRLPYEMRGRPDLFVILPWLKAYRDWLEERARINRRKSVYYHVKLKNAQNNQVATMQAKFKQPPAPGSIIVTNDNVEWVVLDSNIRAGEASEDGRQIKLMAVAGMQLPEFYFADGANANLASATAQQLPALKKFSDYQDILTDQLWKPIFKRVIASAVKAGRITGEAVEGQGGVGTHSDDVMLEMVSADGDPVLDEAGKPKMVRASEAFDYQYPQVEEKDPYNLAKALQIAVQAEWAANETAAQEMGYDPQIENKKIEAEAARRLERAMNTPRGFNPDGTPVPVPPRDMATLAKADKPGETPNAKQNGGGPNGATVAAGSVDERA